jgi:hypothetical protein
VVLVLEHLVVVVAGGQEAEEPLASALAMLVQAQALAWAVAVTGVVRAQVEQGSVMVLPQEQVWELRVQVAVALQQPPG